jgi:hypothetical protein
LAARIPSPLPTTAPHLATTSPHPVTAHHIATTSPHPVSNPVSAISPTSTGQNRLNGIGTGCGDVVAMW